MSDTLSTDQPNEPPIDQSTTQIIEESNEAFELDEELDAETQQTIKRSLDQAKQQTGNRLINHGLRYATKEEITVLSPFEQSINPEYSHYLGPDDAPWVSVTDDGGVLILLLDEHDQPVVDPLPALLTNPEPKCAPLSRVAVLLSAVTSTNQPLYQSHYTDDELSFILGHATICRGIELLCASLSVNQSIKARIRGVDYGFSPTKLRSINATNNLSVEAADNLHFILRVRRWEIEPTLRSMSIDQKLEYVRTRQALGKQLIAHNEWMSAYRQYERATTILESIGNDRVSTAINHSINQSIHQSDDQPNERQRNDRDTLLMTMYANAAQCQSTKQNWIQVVEMCDIALTIHQSNKQSSNEALAIKARYRRAQAHVKREEWKSAKADFEELIECYQKHIAEQSNNQPNDQSNTASKPFPLTETIVQQIHRSLAKINQQAKQESLNQSAKWKGILSGNKSVSLYDDVPDQPVESTNESNEHGSSIAKQLNESFPELSITQTVSMLTDSLMSVGSRLVNQIRGCCGRRKND